MNFNSNLLICPNQWTKRNKGHGAVSFYCDTTLFIVPPLELYDLVNVFYSCHV